MLWFKKAMLVPYLGPQFATCWPFFQRCRGLPIGEFFLPIVALILVVGGSLAIPLFLKKHRMAFGFWALFFLSLLRWLTCLTDYGFLGNYHYINLLIIAVYLFVPRKRELIPLLLVGIYVASALLKFNVEWLSGAALLHDIPLQSRLLKASLYLAVVIEGVGSWALLSSNRDLRRVAVGLFLIFHLLSVYVIGFYFSFVMICMLSFFVLLEMEPLEPPFFDPLFFKSLSKSTVAVMFLFAVAQVAPHILSHDSALGGIARISSLNMLDARAVCEASAMIETDTGYEHLTNFARQKNVRTACDPIEYLATIDRICKQQDTGRIHFTLQSRRTTDDHFTRILDLPDACHTSYNLLFAELFNAQQSI